MVLSPHICTTRTQNCCYMGQAGQAGGEVPGLEEVSQERRKHREQDLRVIGM